MIKSANVLAPPSVFSTDQIRSNLILAETPCAGAAVFNCRALCEVGTALHKTREECNPHAYLLQRGRFAIDRGR
jgi:hypothetical protein